MRDKTLSCIQCDNAFTLTGEEQEKLLARGFGLPKRCPDCRKKKAKGLQSGPEEARKKGRKKHPRDKERLWEEEA